MLKALSKNAKIGCKSEIMKKRTEQMLIQEIYKYTLSYKNMTEVEGWKGRSQLFEITSVIRFSGQRSLLVPISLHFNSLSPCNSCIEFLVTISQLRKELWSWRLNRDMDKHCLFWQQKNVITTKISYRDLEQCHWFGGHNEILHTHKKVDLCSGGREELWVTFKTSFYTIQNSCTFILPVPVGT